MRTLQWLFIFLLVIPLGINAQPSGKYKGKINVLGRQIDIEFNLQSNKGTLTEGTLSLPGQGAYNLSIKEIIYKDGNFKLFVDTAMSKFRFEGTYHSSQDSMGGKLFQAGYEGTFYAHPKAEEKTSWIDKEVEFYNGDIKLAGVVSLPDNENEHPAVIFISGSGTQDRDENVRGFKVFKQMAQHFIENGYAVLRYDDRGAGKSDDGNVDKATTADFTEDARCAFDFLKTYKHIDSEHIGFLGHSEGAVIATRIAANSDDIAFTVMMGGPTLKGFDILIEQTKALSKAQGRNPKEIRQTIKINKKIYREALKDNPDWEKMKKMLHDGLQLVGASSSETVVQQQLNALKSPWFHYFLHYDPAKDLKKIQCPVLALFGEKDTQVPPEPNMKRLKKITRNHPGLNVTVKEIPQANHLFQNAKTGAVHEYGSLPKQFVDGFPENVIHWTDKVTQ